MTNQFVTVERSGSSAMITLRRSKALNALNATVLAELLAAASELSADPSIRVVLMTGEGDRAFIAGADITEFVGASPADALQIGQRIKQLNSAITSMPKPVVAVINGYCLGGGLEVALACDIRIASTTARLGLPEIKLGILPGGGGTVRLSKIAGSSVARMLAMTGEPISADRAMALGLLYSVHPPEELAGAAKALAVHLESLAPFAMAQLKNQLNIAVDADTASAIEAEIKSLALCFSTQDQEEGAAAFLEKRKPNLTGR
jgi:enoyl-CoA hydratase/carnithine racemase